MPAAMVSIDLTPTGHACEICECHTKWDDGNGVICWDCLYGQQLDEPGFVYFIRNNDTRDVKIGFSKDPDSRLDDLQICNGSHLYIESMFPGSKQDEKALHHVFGKHRKSGEWFRPNEQLDRMLFNLPYETWKGQIYDWCREFAPDESAEFDLLERG